MQIQDHKFESLFRSTNKKADQNNHARRKKIRSNLALMKFLKKSHLIVNPVMNGKSRGGEGNLEERTEEITPENQETQGNPKNPKTALRKKLPIHAKKATVELNIMENGAKLIVGVTSTIETLATSSLVNLQRDGAKERKEKADGSQRNSVMMENARCKNAVMNTKNLHVARKV